MYIFSLKIFLFVYISRTISAQTLGQASTAGDGLGSIDGSITRAVGHGDFAVEQRL